MPGEGIPAVGLPRVSIEVKQGFRLFREQVLCEPLTDAVDRNGSCTEVGVKGTKPPVSATCHSTL